MPEEKKTSGKAVGVTGGGGVGLFLIKLAGFVSDPTLKDLFIASIPMISILLSEVFTFAWTIYAIDPQEVRLKRRLKELKKQAEAVLNATSPPVSQDMRNKAQDRYDVICGIEMGIYPLSVINTLDGKAVSAASTEDAE
ncbi:hypothetical protein IFR07_08050 [Pantoea agglomerans]|uniref:hypothetical protein n=1 Tax=Enterobacter agglomerans TaxID=549 RepID=UPI00177D6346|nr:hypothetical protein [Pantoea agglomerans]MBD8116848.1 hypothetical protein [Pantoea agglomerans]